MPLYRWNADNLENVTPTTFEAEGLQERADLQRLLRDQPEVLEEGLFIVAEEFSNWQDSGRSIDLLALDDQARLVVIELKRTQTGDHSELQAIRYAAMVSSMTLEQIIEAHRDYLAKRSRDEDARAQILNHLGVADEADTEIHTERPRIVLASAGFSTELTTSVLWLRDGGMDISCVKLQLYRSSDGLLMDTSQVIPLPEASNYLVKVRERVDEERRQHRNSPMETTTGGSVFLNAIGHLREEYKPMITQLYDWAVSLEQEDLAILQVRQGSWNTMLRPHLPGTNEFLAMICKSGGTGSYRLRPNRIRTRAPKANALIKEILGQDIYVEDSTDLRVGSAPSDELLDALTDAYREANGKLAPTTPLPDTGPDSPAPVV